MDINLELIDFLNNINNQNNNFNLQYLELLELRRNHRRKYTVRKRFNPMLEYDDAEFLRRFRFPKAEVQEIYDSINGAATLEPMVK